MTKRRTPRNPAEEALERIRRAHSDSDDEDNDSYESEYDSDDEIFRPDPIRSSTSSPSEASVTSIDASGNMATPAVSSLGLLHMMANRMGVKIEPANPTSTPNVVGKLSTAQMSALEKKLTPKKREQIAVGKLSAQENLNSAVAFMEGFLSKKQAAPTSMITLPDGTQLTPEEFRQMQTKYKKLGEKREAAAIVIQEFLRKKLFANRVAPAILDVEQSAVTAVEAASAISDEVLHDVTIPDTKLLELADEAVEAARATEDSTNDLEVVVTNCFEWLDEEQMQTANRFIELGDAIVEAARDKAHAAQAAIARNKAVEHARSALARTKAIEGAANKAKSKTYSEDKFTPLKEKELRRLEAARAEVREDHEAAKLKEAELKAADEAARVAAATAMDILIEEAAISRAATPLSMSYAPVYSITEYINFQLGSNGSGFKGWKYSSTREFSDGLLNQIVNSLVANAPEVRNQRLPADDWKKIKAGHRSLDEQIYATMSELAKRDKSVRSYISK